MSATRLLTPDVLVSADASSDPEAVARLRSAYQLLRSATALTSRHGSHPAFNLADAQRAVHIALGDWLSDLPVLMPLADALRVLAKADRGETDMAAALRSTTTRLHMALSHVTYDDAAPDSESNAS